MDTQILKAIEVLSSNGIVVFPSDTVWGVGCSLNSVAVSKLYQIKNREETKPTGIYVKDLVMAKEFGQFTVEAEKLAHQHWPGALSIVVKATEKVDPIITGNTPNISLRIPDHPILLELLQLLDQPLVQTSANFAGDPPPMTKEAIKPEFTQLVDLILPGESLGQAPSTVVDASGKDLKILRSGPIKLE